MKTKLREYFDDRIIITTINGKSNVVAMRRTTESILFEFRNNHIKDQSSEKKSHNRSCFEVYSGRHQSS